MGKTDEVPMDGWCCWPVSTAVTHCWLMFKSNKSDKAERKADGGDYVSETKRMTLVVASLLRV